MSMDRKYGEKRQLHQSKAHKWNTNGNLQFEYGCYQEPIKYACV